MHSGAEGGDVLVRVSATAHDVKPVATVSMPGEVIGTIENVSETSVIEPRPRFLTLGERGLCAAMLLPGGREPDGPLPVLMDPYGGPHGARVLKAAGAHLTSQWFADQGFAVLVVDGRGVDGRGPGWDREMYRDFTVALEDQVDALHAAAERFDFLDLGRVAMRGWSFGGELTALALLRRPDVFHAGVVGDRSCPWIVRRLLGLGKGGGVSEPRTETNASLRKGVAMRCQHVDDDIQCRLDASRRVAVDCGDPPDPDQAGFAGTVYMVWFCKQHDPDPRRSMPIPRTAGSVPIGERPRR